MRRTILYFSLFVFFGCKSIDKLEPNQTETFLKIYGESNKTKASDLFVLNDGYLVLGTYSETASLLLKTDLQGNKLWATSFDNFIAKSICVIDDPTDGAKNGYIIIGDSIYNADTTYMHLIKTNFEGTRLNSVTLTNQPSTFGSAVTFTSADEVVALGYGNFGNAYSSAIMMGYTFDLVEKWQSNRIYSISNQNILPSPSLFETYNDNLAWLNYSEGTTRIEATFTQPDNDSPVGGTVLFNNQTLKPTISDFVKTPVGYAIAQPVLDGTQYKIGVSTFDLTVLDENVISTDDGFQSGNYFPAALVNTPNGLLVAATTDQHEGGSASPRTDVDLFLLEVGYNGKPKSDGIKSSFGGLGDEIPVRIRNTADGGYIVVGTLINTKNAEQIFLLKTNSKGALN